MSNKAKAEAVEGVISVKIVDGSCTILAHSEDAAELARDVLEFMQVCYVCMYVCMYKFKVVDGSCVSFGAK